MVGTAAMNIDQKDRELIAACVIKGHLCFRQCLCGERTVCGENSLKAESTCLMVLENDRHLLSQKDVLEYLVTFLIR